MVMDKLMRGLGFESGVSQNWRYRIFVSRVLGVRKSDACKCVHLHLCIGVGLSGNEGLSQEEQKAIGQARRLW